MQAARTGLILLTVSTTHPPATDLGFLLKKHPDRCQTFDLSFGQAHVFYPEASAERCTMALLLDVDPIGLVRGRGPGTRPLEVARDRLHIDRLPPAQAARIRLVHSSLTYRDKRLAGYEVIEHLDPPRLVPFERVLFEFASPRAVVLTTPNAWYNVRFEDMEPGGFRHRDHRFEWNRREFQTWATRTAQRFGYGVRFLPVGPEDPSVGPPTQMALFTSEGGPGGVSRQGTDR